MRHALLTLAKACVGPVCGAETLWVGGGAWCRVTYYRMRWRWTWDSKTGWGDWVAVAWALRRSSLTPGKILSYYTRFSQERIC
ncbi:hypothetical protein BJ912DRAFT_1000886 [Pholiota molesta]|nr:hypothetical protein BJ912DRAFT_1000886 [Pholiota molesta]